MASMPTTPALALWIVRSATRLAATFAVLQGLGIILSHPRRWGSDAFLTALSIPGAPPVWGWLLAGAGALALGGSLARRPRLVMLGLYLSAAWSLFFALSFIRSALVSPTASTTGIGSYLFLAALMVLLAEAHRRRA